MGGQRIGALNYHKKSLADLVLMVVDLSRPEREFDSMSHWMNESFEKANCWKVIVGNKADIRMISIEEAKEKARKLGMKYYETNALDWNRKSVIEEILIDMALANTLQ